MGYFKIEFKYVVHNYDIVFESERGVFVIEILDADGAHNSLYRIHKFNNITSIENVERAVQLLKQTFEKNDFYLYFRQHNKLYIYK